MSSDDLLQRLRVIEMTNHPILSVSAEGFSIWPGIKSALMVHHMYGRSGKALSIKADGRTLRLGLRHLVKMMTRRQGRAKRLLFGAISTVRPADGIGVDLLLPAGAQFDRRYYHCANLDKLESLGAFSRAADLVIENLPVALVRRILSLVGYPRLSVSDRASCEALCASLAPDFPELDVSMPMQVIAGIRFEAAFWRWYLRPLCPEEAVMISPYSKVGKVVALKSLGVRVIEIQHGIAGSRHAAYNYVPELKTLTLPMAVPDEIRAFDALWRDEIMQSGYFDADTVVIGGNPRLERALECAATVEEGAYVLFTGQGAFRDVVRAFVEEYLNKCGTRARLLYRPHPSEDVGEIRREFADLLARGLEMADDTSQTTEQLLAGAQAHVSVSSACHFDAVSLLGQTYFLPTPASEDLMSYYEGRAGKDLFIRLTDASQLLARL